jgi:WD40 repeat protein/predicted Ser/Thr protein kinase
MTDKTTDGSAHYLMLTKLADEFAARYRDGQRPSLQEYIDRYPELADEIRELLPAMVEIEQVRDDQQHAAPPAAAAPAPAIRQLGDFRIIREVGKGGMGFVYEAEQMSLGRHVALKLLPRNMLIDAKAKRRFEREAKAAARLHHTNIVPVFGIGEQDGMPYYVMQFIGGLGLDDVLEELKKLQRNHVMAGARADGELPVWPDVGEVPSPPGEATGLETRTEGAVSAMNLATSLLTGAFQSSLDEDDKDTAPVGPDGARTEDPGSDAPCSPALPDSFSLSGSSVLLPGRGRDGSKSRNRQRTYWQSVALIGAQVADALEYAHKQGIHHRDIKPSNLLLDKQGTVWVTDFGLAKAVDDQQNLTRTGDILGTLRYMPPEAFEGKTDAKSDVYSLGITLYEMLALRPAFTERERNRLIRQVTNEEPERLDRLNPRVPRDLVTVVQKAIERDPERRYATAKELAADLERFIDDEPILARRQTELERYVRWARHNPGIAALGAVLTSVLVVVTIASVFVALYMISLASEKAQNAAAERLARLAAVDAQKREAEERTKADMAKKAAETSSAAARQAERLARAAEEQGRKLLYTTDMQLAPFVWRDDRTTAEQLRLLLARHVPEERMKDEGGRMKPDLRGFEWWYYQHLLEHSAAVFSGHVVAVEGGVFASGGQLVTLDQKGQLRRWDVDSQHEDEASRRDLPGGPLAQVRVLSPDGRLAALAAGNKVRVFDTTTGDEKFAVDSASTSFRRPIFSHDGDRLVIVDDKIRWLSAKSGAVIASFDQILDRVENLDLSADGLTLAVVGHGAFGYLASIFRLDAAAKTVTPLARDFGIGVTLSASALTPDGGRIAVSAKVSLSGGLFVFNAATGRLIAAHGSAHASPISAIAFSEDGAKLATADAEGTVKIWADLEKMPSKRAALLTLKGHQGAINRVGFSSDSKRLVTASADKTARVWDLENAGASIRPLELPSRDGSLVVRFSPDGQLIAAADGRSVRLWDAATGRLVRELPPVEKGRIFGVAFSPTDNRLLAVGYGGEANVSYVSLWDIDAAAELARLPGATDLPNFHVDLDTGAVGALAFSPNGKCLVAGFGRKYWFSEDVSPNPLKVWDVATRRLIRRLNGHTGYCVSLDFSRDGTLLASGSRDGTAIIWSTATWKAMHTLQNPDQASLYSQAGRSQVEDVAFSPDGKTLALASFGGNVQSWDVATGKLLHTLKGHSSGVNAVVFSPDGRTLASASSDQTVRLWNVETRRELMQLDPRGVMLGQVRTLAFSPDGRHLLAGGGRTAFWSTTPSVWNDTERAAEKLRLLLKSNADFRSRIRMLSENLRLHEALAKVVEGGRWRVEGTTSPPAGDHPSPTTRHPSPDWRVQAALAATQANWHASREAWPEAVAAFDRLIAADPTSPEGWLRTPALLRLATALLHRNRPAVAARLLQGGAKRRAQDGLPAVVDTVGTGFAYSVAGDTVRVTELLPVFPGSRAGLVPGDTIVKVNDTELTRESIPKFHELLAGDAGTKVRLTVRHPGSDKPEVIELTRARFVNDQATGELLYPLRTFVNERLAKAPRDARLLELRAELAGQWSGSEAQVADYSAAIEALAHQTREAAAPDLKRLYGSRGNAHLALRHWQQALDDYAHVVIDTTTDEELLTNQATALAEVLLPLARWTVLKPVDAKSELGATFSILRDDSILVSGAHRWKDRYHVELMLGTDINLTTVRLEALTHDSLPNHGPGRHPTGTFAQVSWNVTATRPAGKDPITLKFDNAWADHQLVGYPIDKNGHWNIYGGHGGNCTAIWSMSKPVCLPAGTTLTFEMQCQTGSDAAENIGHFRLSASSDPAAIEQEPKLLAATKLTDPWQKLAAAYQLEGDQRAIDQLVKRRPKLAGSIGDLFTQEPHPDWQRAVEIYSKGVTPQTTDADLLSRRAGAYEALKKWDAAAAEWSRAAAGNPDGARLLAEFARRLAAAGQVPSANGQFDKAQALYERLLAADPENEVVATELARLHLHKQEIGPWTVLKPMEMKSRGGATLRELADHSILAGGVNPRADRYTVRFIIPEKLDIRSIRLEALTDDSLPGRGPGRGTDGLFALARWDVTAKRPGGADSPRSLNFRAACADYTWIGAPLGVLGEWSISWDGGRDHISVWSVTEPITLEAGSQLVSDMRFNELPDWADQNLGRFRISVSSDPAAFNNEAKRLAAIKLTDPWAKLAAVYLVVGDQQALDTLLKDHPEAASGVGYVYAASQDWERAIAEYRKLVTDQRADVAVLTKFATACQSAGRTREAIGHLARASAANPNDTVLSLKVAAYQAWFGQEKELAATRQRILAFAKDTTEAFTAERAAKACSILPSTDEAELAAALALGRSSVKLGSRVDSWNLLALGMSEYRNGNSAPAENALLAAAEAAQNVPQYAPQVTGISSFFRAMSLFRLGKKDDARELAIAAATKMKPLPADEQNPLPLHETENDLIVWLAYKEAKATIQFDAGTPAKAENGKN